MTIINIPKKFNNYDEKMFNHLQELNFMMLEDFIEICDNHDIEYFLSYGTLIGAVRHNGFIPWDDDIDLFMFRDQHDKLIRIMNENPSEKYEILSLENQKDYCRVYSQFNLKGTKTEEYYDLKSDFTLGLSLDIFVLDNMPSKTISMKYFIVKQKIYKKLLWIHEIVYNEAYISKNKERLGKIIKIIFKIFNINSRTIKKLAYNLINSCDSNDSEYVCDLYSVYGIEPYPRKWFSEAKKVKFESIEVNIPVGYDEYLTLIYGDYMKVPPEEERLIICIIQLILDRMSYSMLVK